MRFYVCCEERRSQNGTFFGVAPLRTFLSVLHCLVEVKNHDSILRLVYIVLITVSVFCCYFWLLLALYDNLCVPFLLHLNSLLLLLL
jgi:hypothetical protein